jgi:DNA-binding MurR/RpiR family transcriptional regulator
MASAVSVQILLPATIGRMRTKIGYKEMSTTKTDLARHLARWDAVRRFFRFRKSDHAGEVEQV